MRSRSNRGSMERSFNEVRPWGFESSRTTAHIFFPRQNGSPVEHTARGAGRSGHLPPRTSMSSPSWRRDEEHLSCPLVRVLEFGPRDNASSERNFSVAWYSSHRHESETQNLAQGKLTSLSVQIVEPDPSATQCGVGSCCTARDCKGNLARFPGD